MSIVSSVKGNQTFAIVGGAISGAGVIFSIPSFVNIHRAGKEKLRGVDREVQDF